MFIQLLIREDPRHGKDRHHLKRQTFGHCEALFTWKIFKKKTQNFQNGNLPSNREEKKKHSKHFISESTKPKKNPKLELDMFRANSAVRNQAFPASCAEIPICPMFGSVASNEIYKHVLNHVWASSRWNWQICKLFIAIWNVNYILLNVRLLKTSKNHLWRQNSLSCHTCNWWFHPLKLLNWLYLLWCVELFFPNEYHFKDAEAQPSSFSLHMGAPGIEATAGRIIDVRTQCIMKGKAMGPRLCLAFTHETIALYSYIYKK